MATASQTRPPRLGTWRSGTALEPLESAALFNSMAMSLSLSQNCLARPSQIRASVRLVGERISIARTGSQTTKTDSGRFDFDRISWSAEAPCTHPGQVGEKKAMTLVRSSAALKGSLDVSMFRADSKTRGHCAAVVRVGPRIQPRKVANAAK